MSYEMYVDGACRGNGKADAVGGWGVYVPNRDGGSDVELFGGEVGTTNNRMELKAAIEGIGYAKANSLENIDIYTDSNYVKQGITDWIKGWKRRNWANVKNRDLWEVLDKLNESVKPNWHWVRGHDVNEGNIKADQLANCGCDVAGADK